MSYNGWKNWATWYVYNQLCSDEVTYAVAMTCRSPEMLKLIFNKAENFDSITSKMFKDVGDKRNEIDWKGLYKVFLKKRIQMELLNRLNQL